MKKGFDRPTLIFLAIVTIVFTVLLWHINSVCSTSLAGLIAYANQTADPRTAEAINTEPEYSLVSLNEFKITHYCPCVKCCGKTDRITYTGTVAMSGRTIAVDPNVIPLGSTVVIDGCEYLAEDIGGGIKDRTIDIFVDDHQEALNLGVRMTEVRIFEDR